MQTRAAYAAGLVVDVPQDRFEELVADALDSIPDELGRLMDNVAVVVEEGRPTAACSACYEGIPLTERDGWYGTGDMVMPDRITIFRRPILAPCAEDEEEVVSRCASPSSTRSPTTSASTTTASTSSAGPEAVRPTLAACRSLASC